MAPKLEEGRIDSSKGVEGSCVIKNFLKDAGLSHKKLRQVCRANFSLSTNVSHRAGKIQVFLSYRILFH